MASRGGGQSLSTGAVGSGIGAQRERNRVMERLKKAGINARGRIDWHIDTARGWAALEEMVLDARQDVRAAFAAFDADAPLYSPRARAIGQCWRDLIIHTLGRGVKVSILVDDPAPCGELPSAQQLILGEQTDRIDAAPHIGRRCGDLTLAARAHPAQRPGRELIIGFRMNLALIDLSGMFVARCGPSRAPTGRDLAMVARGPVVGEAAHFFDEYAEVCSGGRDPSPARRLLRTLARPGRGVSRLFGIHTVANEIEAAHHMLIRRAEKLIYIETQRFDNAALAAHLVQRAKAAPDLGLILVLPDPPAGRDAVRCVKALSRGFGPRLLAVHARSGCTNISVFDDAMAIAGSVDLSMRSLRRDTGVSLYLRAADGVADLRTALSRRWISEIGATADAPFWRSEIVRGMAPDLEIL